MKRTRLVYVCSYDGNICEKAIPKIDEDGYLIPESNKELLDKYRDQVDSNILEGAWDICEGCHRNLSVGYPCGILKCEQRTIGKA